MTAARRGSLASMAVPKTLAAEAVPPAEAGPEAAPSPAASAPRRPSGDLKTVQVRINKPGWRALRDLASDNDTSLEALMVEALNDVLLKHRRPPIVERRVGERGQERGE